METCVICECEIKGFVVPRIDSEGNYAPCCLDCDELLEEEEGDETVH